MEEQSLCWDCAKGAAECCFMKDMEPVQNWKAKKVPYDGYYGTSHTYHVINCPDFEASRELGKTEKRRFKTKKGTRVRCIETGRVYSSIRECSRDMNISQPVLSSYLAYPVGTVKGYHFEKIKNSEIEYRCSDRGYK